MNGGDSDMKVVAFNGSPNGEGNTFQALRTVADELEKQGIEVEICHIGHEAIRGCQACRGCVKNKNQKCIHEDGVNEWIQKMIAADGILFGAPVHYADIGGTMKSFLDRAFFVSSANGNLFRHKVGAGIVAARRAGGVFAMDQLNHYITYSEMVVPTANYWNVAYGLKKGDASLDLEGMQIMRMLGKNMAWVMKLVEHGEGVIDKPMPEDKVYFNMAR